MQPSSLPSADTAQRFLRAFWGVRQRVLRSADPVVESRHALGLKDYFLLRYVAGSALSPGEIAVALDLPAHGVSRRLDALERRGLIRRSVHPDDARRRVLTPTAAGRTRLREATDTLNAHMQAMLGALEPPRVADLVSSLETLAKERTA